MIFFKKFGYQNCEESVVRQAARPSFDPSLPSSPQLRKQHFIEQKGDN